MKTISAVLLLSLSVFITGCSVFEGRPEQNNTNQARGSYAWMTERLNEEQEAGQLDGQFGNQSTADANDERPDAINTDATFPGMDRN